MLPFYKQKTFWTALAGIVTATGGYFAGEISLTALLASTFAGLGAIFMRMGVEKSKLSESKPSERGDEVK